MTLPEFAIAGIPLSIIIVALVEEIKEYGVTGKILRLVAMLIGVGLSVAVQLGKGLPADFMGWLTTIVVGVLYGITASGGYDLVDKRLPAKV